MHGLWMTDWQDNFIAAESSIKWKQVQLFSSWHWGRPWLRLPSPFISVWTNCWSAQHCGGFTHFSASFLASSHIVILQISWEAEWEPRELCLAAALFQVSLKEALEDPTIQTFDTMYPELRCMPKASCFWGPWECFSK